MLAARSPPGTRAATHSLGSGRGLHLVLLLLRTVVVLHHAPVFDARAEVAPPSSEADDDEPEARHRDDGRRRDLDDADRLDAVLFDGALALGSLVALEPPDHCAVEAL